MDSNEGSCVLQKMTKNWHIEAIISRKKCPASESFKSRFMGSLNANPGTLVEELILASLKVLAKSISAAPCKTKTKQKRKQTQKQTKKKKYPRRIQ